VVIDDLVYPKTKLALSERLNIEKRNSKRLRPEAAIYRGMQRESAHAYDFPSLKCEHVIAFSVSSLHNRLHAINFDL
jgi:hypothetical protein